MAATGAASSEPPRSPCPPPCPPANPTNPPTPPLCPLYPCPRSERQGVWDTAGLQGAALHLVAGDRDAANWLGKLEVVKQLLVDQGGWQRGGAGGVGSAVLPRVVAGRRSLDAPCTLPICAPAPHLAAHPAYNPTHPTAQLPTCARGWTRWRNAYIYMQAR